MRRAMHAGKIAALICGLLLISAARAETISLNIGKSTIRAEIAATPAERERGLMQRTQLCADCGMLFIFPRAEPHVFWMKNTPLPLSVAFVSADGRILNIEEMQAESTDYHRARGNALFALEMNRGWFARHGIRPGDRLEGLQQAPQGR